MTFVQLKLLCGKHDSVSFLLSVLSTRGCRQIITKYVSSWTRVPSDKLIVAQLGKTVITPVWNPLVQLGVYKGLVFFFSFFTIGLEECRLEDCPSSALSDYLFSISLTFCMGDVTGMNIDHGRGAYVQKLPTWWLGYPAAR